MISILSSNFVLQDVVIMPLFIANSPHFVVTFSSLIRTASLCAINIRPLPFISLQFCHLIMSLFGLRCVCLLFSGSQLNWFAASAFKEFIVQTLLYFVMFVGKHQYTCKHAQASARKRKHKKHDANFLANEPIHSFAYLNCYNIHLN